MRDFQILSKDDFDRMMRVSSSQTGRLQDNRYDVNGLRNRKLDKNGNSSLEYDVGISMTSARPGSQASAAPVVSYIAGHMLLGAEVDGVFQYFLHNALSSVTDVTNEAGTVIKSWEFNEYGNLISSAGSGASASKTFVGGSDVHDDTGDSGMFLMGHRHYMSELGAFASRDPIGFAGDLNLLRYANNSPATFTDPTGLQPPWTPTGYYVDYETKTIHNAGGGGYYPPGSFPSTGSSSPQSLLAPHQVQALTEFSNRYGLPVEMVLSIGTIGVGISMGMVRGKGFGRRGGQRGFAKMRSTDSCNKVSVRGKSVTSGKKKLEAAGLTEVSGRRHRDGRAWVDARNIVRAAWDRASAIYSSHWHKFNSTGQPINNAGRLVNPNSPAAHISDGTRPINRNKARGSTTPIRRRPGDGHP